MENQRRLEQARGPLRFIRRGRRLNRGSRAALARTMKIFPITILLAFLAGCTPSREDSAARRLLALPTANWQEFALACDTLLHRVAPSEEPAYWSPSDPALPTIFRELGATRVIYPARLDWEPVGIFVTFTAETNTWGDHACVIRWTRNLTESKSVSWETSGDLSLWKPSAMYTELWEGLGEKN